jgi:hypothetical protein
MMFRSHSKPQAEERRRELQEANKILTDAIEVHFTQEYQTMRKEALEAGVSLDNVDTVIQRIKWKAQIELIKQFKEELTIVVREGTRTSCKPK